MISKILSFQKISKPLALFMGTLRKFGILVVVEDRKLVKLITSIPGSQLCVDCQPELFLNQHMHARTHTHPPTWVTLMYGLLARALSKPAHTHTRMHARTHTHTPKQAKGGREGREWESERERESRMEGKREEGRRKKRNLPSLLGWALLPLCT